jgi:predicted molibdopterin-dependent oxidoreductase YjgC
MPKSRSVANTGSCGVAAGAPETLPAIKMAALTIDGRQVEAPVGSTVLEAAELAGIRIPTLCYHPDLSVHASCRICVVEVEKMPGLQTACSLQVAENMVVHSDTPAVRAERRTILELILSNHPNDCMKCEVTGDCELQDLVYEYQVEWPEYGGQRHRYAVDSDPNPFVFVDMNKCILCTRCVRACAEVQCRDVWAVAGRGCDTRIVAGAETTMLEARCESCGQCVAYCPVGALHDKMSLVRGRPYQVEKVTTTCVYCGVGCQFDLNVYDGRVMRVTSNPDAPVNGMALCVKGRYGYDFIHHPDRLTTPLVKRDGEFVAASWDEALDLVATKLAAIREEHGPDALAFLCSAKCTNEENYLLQKFARAVLGTNNVDHCARL